MAKKCMVLIFILIYCMNLFLPIFSFAQVVEDSSFYKYFKTEYEKGTVYSDKYSDKSVFQEAFEKSKENAVLLNALNTYKYWVCLPTIESITSSSEGLRGFNYGVAFYFSNNSEFTLKKYIDYYRLTSTGVHYYYDCYYNNADDIWYVRDKLISSATTDNATKFRHYVSGAGSTKYNLGLSADDYLSCVRSNYDLKYSDSTVAFYTDTSDIKFNVFDDSVIDWSSLFHYYISTKKTTQEDVSIGEYNNKDYYMENNLIFWWDGFEGMLGNSGVVNEDYTIYYHPNLQYTYIIKDIDGNTAELCSGWLGPLEYNTLHQQNLMFLADPTGELSKKEPLYNLLEAVFVNAGQFWIKTVLGDGTIQEWTEDNAIKDYIKNKIEVIWDKQGYLDFDLKVEVMVQKTDLTGENLFTDIWYDTFNVYFNRDNGLTTKPQDSYYTYMSDDFDMVLFPDGNVREIFIKNDNYKTDITEDGRYVIVDKTSGDIVYEYIREDDGKVIIKDGNGTNIFESSNDTDWDMVLDNLEASGFDITGITEEMYEKTEHLTKNYSGVFSIFADIFSWLPFDIDTLIFISFVLLIIFKVFNRLGG